MEPETCRVSLSKTLRGEQILVKEQIKSLLHTLAPKQFDALMAGRINRHGQNFMAKQGVPAIAAALRSTGFSGCRYTGRITRCHP